MQVSFSASTSAVETTRELKCAQARQIKHDYHQQMCMQKTQRAQTQLCISVSPGKAHVQQQALKGRGCDLQRFNVSLSAARSIYFVHCTPSKLVKYGDGEPLCSCPCAPRQNHSHFAFLHLHSHFAKPFQRLSVSPSSASLQHPCDCLAACASLMIFAQEVGLIRAGQIPHHH